MQVIVTHGNEDPGRVALALKTALTAVSSGVQVVVFHSLRATRWSCQDWDVGEDPHGIAALLTQLEEVGVRLECCSACLSKYCSAVVEENGELRNGFIRAGLMTLVQRTATGVPTLTF